MATTKAASKLIVERAPRRAGRKVNNVPRPKSRTLTPEGERLLVDCKLVKLLMRMYYRQKELAGLQGQKYTPQDNVEIIGEIASWDTLQRNQRRDQRRLKKQERGVQLGYAYGKTGRGERLGRTFRKVKRNQGRLVNIADVGRHKGVLTLPERCCLEVALRPKFENVAVQIAPHRKLVVPATVDTANGRRRALIAKIDKLTVLRHPDNLPHIEWTAKLYYRTLSRAIVKLALAMRQSGFLDHILPNRYENPELVGHA